MAYFSDITSSRCLSTSLLFFSKSINFSFCCCISAFSRLTSSWFSLISSFSFCMLRCNCPNFSISLFMASIFDSSSYFCFFMSASTLSRSAFCEAMSLLLPSITSFSF
uniref:Uncharacterized protein n=1 Tax=Anguilla anguilla TaxID=7936 RepID=A0A0E9XMI2_ANGAN